MHVYLFGLHVDDTLMEVSAMPHSCKLGMNEMNIQAYVDDMLDPLPQVGR